MCLRNAIFAVMMSFGKEVLLSSRTRSLQRRVCFTGRMVLTVCSRGSGSHVPSRK